jgi:hypothetical protein
MVQTALAQLRHHRSQDFATMKQHQAKPKIRPGQRVPYRKANQREIDRRRACVARLLARGARKMKIHRLIKEKFNRQWRTADRDIAFVMLTRT